MSEMVSLKRFLAERQLFKDKNITLYPVKFDSTLVQKSKYNSHVIIPKALLNLLFIQMMEICLTA